MTSPVKNIGKQSKINIIFSDKTRVVKQQRSPIQAPESSPPKRTCQYKEHVDDVTQLKQKIRKTKRQTEKAQDVEQAPAEPRGFPHMTPGWEAKIQRRIDADSHRVPIIKDD
jgi:hypothetical protein